MKEPEKTNMRRTQPTSENAKTPNPAAAAIARVTEKPSEPSCTLIVKCSHIITKSGK